MKGDVVHRGLRPVAGLDRAPHGLNDIFQSAGPRCRQPARHLAGGVPLQQLPHGVAVRGIVGGQRGQKEAAAGPADNEAGAFQVCEGFADWGPADPQLGADRAFVEAVPGVEGSLVRGFQDERLDLVVERADVRRVKLQRRGIHPQAEDAAGVGEHRPGLHRRLYTVHERSLSV